MILRKLRVGHFGKLKNVEIDLHSGFNVIYGENESGKSTLQAFIKALFYGMGSQKKDIRENDRIHFIPWGEEKAHGELYFQDQYKNDYVIKRSFGKKKKDDEAAVLHVITGENSAHIQWGRPGEDLFGLGEEAFGKTVWIKQLGCEVVRGKDDEIMKRLTNIQESGDENVSYHRAQEGLNEARKSLLNQRKTGKLDRLLQHHDGLLLEYRNSSMFHDEMMEDQIKLNQLTKERTDQLVEIQQLEESKEHRKEYNSLLQCQEEFYKAEEKKKSLLEKHKEILGQLQGFEGYDGLDDNIEYRLFNAENEKKSMEEKLSEFKFWQKEYLEVEDRLKNILENLGKLIIFQKVTMSMETEVYILEEALKELQYKRNLDGKRDSISLRIDILKDKNRILTAAVLLGAVILLGGGASGLLLNKLLFALCGIGVAVLTLGTVNKRKNYTQLKQLESELFNLGNREYLEGEIHVLSRKLHDIYSEFGVGDQRDFREGLRKYGEHKEDIEALKVKLEEKGQILEKMEIQQIKTRLFHANEEIQNILGICNCMDIEEFIHKLKEYRRLSGEKARLEKQLAEAGEEFLYIKQIFEEKAVDKLLYYKEELPLQEEDIDRMLKEKNLTLVEFEKKIKDMEYNIKDKFQQYRHPAQVEEEMGLVKEKVRHYEDTVSSIDMALETLQEAFKEMQKNFGPRLNRIVGDVLGKITDGKYDELKISEDYRIKVVDPMADKIKDMDYFSSGTWDQIYFALRLGLIQLIFDEDKKIPILLDDAFIQYDNHRLEKALNYLYEWEKGRQVLLFTCQKREMEIMKNYPGVNFITLQ